MTRRLEEAMLPSDLPDDLPSFLKRFGTDEQCRAVRGALAGGVPLHRLRP